MRACGFSKDDLNCEFRFIISINSTLFLCKFWFISWLALVCFQN